MSDSKTFLVESAVDNYTLHLFLKKLSTPFVKWPAYRLGIIDAQGTILRPRKTLASNEERTAFSSFDLLVRNLKLIIEKTPKGKTKISNYLASLYLLKEQVHADWYSDEDVLYEGFQDFCDEVYSDQASVSRVHHLMESHLPIPKENDKLEEEEIEEDAPANSVAAGGVAGLTEPVVRKIDFKKKKSFKEFSKDVK